MLELKASTYERLATPHRKLYRRRAIDELKRASVSGRIDVGHLGLESDEQFDLQAGRWIDEAHRLGAEATVDILFFAALMLHNPKKTAHGPASAWLHALIADTVHPFSDRMDAIFALLPEDIAGRLAIGLD